MPKPTQAGIDKMAFLCYNCINLLLLIFIMNTTKNRLIASL